MATLTKSTRQLRREHGRCGDPACMQQCPLSPASSDGFHSNGDGSGRKGNDRKEEERDWDGQPEGDGQPEAYLQIPRWRRRALQQGEDILNSCNMVHVSVPLFPLAISSSSGVENDWT
ncbi:hypothetical protein PR202_gb05331 [Eleusine coracana subsp. coracana]|uniref:Uncharacterized protein n=1 Tax=Eleusine coracana subsp. coracana TaxID=191504 RepID=A0AAV5E475_ELECO|nr:hypothetical protein PR202_gb05331 [Eleusine coracana subsp. coracana]